MKIITVQSDYTEKKYVFHDIHPHLALNEVGKSEIEDALTEMEEFVPTK